MYNPDMTNQEKLEEIYRLSHENNHLLHKMLNRDRIAFALRIVYWLAILGVLGGAYYYIRPALEVIAGSSTTGFFDQIQELINALLNASQYGGRVPAEAGEV